MSACIQHPQREPLLMLRLWQLDFCDGDHCAAALLSLFEYWHNVRIKRNSKNGHFLQFHTDAELRAGLLDLYGTTKIREARRLLVVKGAVSEHENPNLRYAFDKTIYFQFHPEVVNDWLEQRYNSPPVADDPSPDESQLLSDSSFFDVTCVKNDDSCVKNDDSFVRNDASYTEITSLEITSETTTTPLPPSFTKPDQQDPQEEASCSGGGEEEKQESARPALILDGVLENLSNAQKDRLQRRVHSLDPDTAQQVVDDFAQAIKTNSIKKSKWGWLESVVRRAKDGTFTPTNDAAERRQAEKKRKADQEARDVRDASLRERLSAQQQQPPQPLEKRTRERPEGLKKLLRSLPPGLRERFSDKEGTGVTPDGDGDS